MWWFSSFRSEATLLIKVSYLRSIVVHGQHAEHMQGVPTFDEFSHSVWLDALASLLCGWGLVARWVGQLVHADNTVLKAHEISMLRAKLHNTNSLHRNLFTIRLNNHYRTRQLR